MKRDVVIYFLGKFVPALVNLVMIFLVVRFLGNDQYGKYSLIAYFALLVMQLCSTWIQQSMIRFLSTYKEDPGGILTRFFTLTLLSILAGIVIMIPICVFYFRLALFETLVVIAYTSLFIFFTFRLTLYQAFMKPVKYAVYESSYNLFLLIFLLGFIFVFVSKNFIMVFVSMTAAFILAEVLHYFFLREDRYRIDVFRPQWDRDFSKSVADYGVPLTIWIFLSTFMMIADRYMIKEFGDYGAAGTYAAVKDLVTKITTFAILPISMAYTAKIYDAWNNQNEARARSLIREVLLVELVVAVVVCTCFFIFSDWIYLKILHLNGTNLFFISVFLIISAFLWQAAMYLHKPMELTLTQKTMVMLIAASLLLNLLLNLFLIPKYGYPAAAVVALVSVVFYCIGAAVFSHISMRRHFRHAEKN